VGFATDGNGWHPDDVETTIRRPISVASLLEREGFEPTRRRAARRALSGVAAGAVHSLGAVVGSLFLGHGRTTAGDTLATGGFVKSGGDVILAETTPHTPGVTAQAEQHTALPHQATSPQAHTTRQPAGHAPTTGNTSTVQRPVTPQHKSDQSAATGDTGGSPVAGAASMAPATTPSDTDSQGPSTQSAPASTQSATTDPSTPTTSGSPSTTGTPSTTTTPPTGTTTTTPPSTTTTQSGGLLGGVGDILGGVTDPVFHWFG
jgi:hypothetical protein